MTIENPLLKAQGARWWHTDDHSSPSLSKASLGAFFFVALRAGAQIGEIWAFNRNHPRSPVYVTVFMTQAQKEAIESATPVRFRPPPKISLNQTE